MALPTRTLQQLLLLMLAYVCIGPATFTLGRSLLQAADEGNNAELLPSIVGPAVRGLQPPPPEEPVTTSSSADIAQTLAPLYTRMLNRHNVLRMRHGAPNMTWDSGLAATAQAWAKGCKFQHSQNSGMQVGENLFAAWISSSTDIPKAAAQAVNEWYREISKYSFANPGFSGETGHFTQVVWKASTKLGCFAAQCPNMFPGWPLAGYVVCNYSPPGNFGGAADYRVNVLPVRRRRAAAAAPVTEEAGAAAAP